MSKSLTYAREMDAAPGISFVPISGSLVGFPLYPLAIVWLVAEICAEKLDLF